MLLIAAHVLGDIDRWWRSQDAELGTDMQVGDVYQLLHRTAVEAEAAWSLLPVCNDSTRIFTTAVALLPIALQLIVRHGDIVAWDIRIYPGRGTSSDSNWDGPIPFRLVQLRHYRFGGASPGLDDGALRPRVIRDRARHRRRVKQRPTAVLRNEVRLGLVTQNVADAAKLPATDVPPRDRRSLTIDEFRRVFKVADGAVGVLVDLCGRNGLRPAEARALRWGDLDLDEGLLHVTGQMDRTNTRGPVKRAANAARTIGIDETTVVRVTNWRSDRDASRAIARSAWTEQGFVAVGGIGQPIGREAVAIANASPLRRCRHRPARDAIRTPPHGYQPPGRRRPNQLGDRRLGRH